MMSLPAVMALVVVQAAPAFRVEDLGWMAGRWEMAADGRWTEEVWSPPRAGLMLGYSRSGRETGIREWEFLRLQAGEDGVPVYWGSPGGRPPVGFRLAASGAASATFENAHTDGNLVTAPAWPAHPEWMRQFLAVLGTKISS